MCLLLSACVLVVWPSTAYYSCSMCILPGCPAIMFSYQHACTCFYGEIQYNTMQCNAMQCNAMQCNAMQCNAMQCNAIQYNTIEYKRSLVCNKYCAALLPKLKTNRALVIRVSITHIFFTVDLFPINIACVAVISTARRARLRLAWRTHCRRRQLNFCINVLILTQPFIRPR